MTTYLPPLPKSVVSQGAYDAMRENLYRVAKYQRWVLVALLANVILAGVSLATVFELFAIPTWMLRTIGVIRLPVCIFMSIAAFLLAKQFWHVVFAAACALGMWIPYASLIVLIILSQKSSKFLQQYGIRVGLLGVNPRKI